MISVAQGTEYRKGNIIFFTGTEEIPCPICGGKLGVHGTCMRTLQRKDKTEKYRLRVMECKKCGKTHRELPERIVPYKRMDAEVLGTIAAETGIGDVEAPDVSTWARIRGWVMWFLSYGQHILEGMRVSMGDTLTTIPLGASLSRQLVYYVRLVANSGNWIQHRSVMHRGP